MGKPDLGWTLDDLPIPEDVRPDASWSPQLLEMAAHIGAYSALMIVERYGGYDLYIAKSTDHYGFSDLIGKAKAETMRWVYGNTCLTVPTAKDVLARARRAPIIALVRKGDITIAEAARRCRTTRRYMSALVRKDEEGFSSDPIALPSIRDPRQIEMFDLQDDAPAR